MSDEPEDEAPSRRQLARKARREDGDQSSRLARQLMEMSTAALGRLGLDEGMRAEVDRARRITALIARRREERRLAGVIRRADGDDLAARMAKVQAGGDAQNRPFHQGEAWRARLLDEGPPALAAFVAAHPDVDPVRLGKLVVDATSERAHGKPRGAGRALFRVVMAALTAIAADAVDDGDDGDGEDADAT